MNLGYTAPSPGLSHFTSWAVYLTKLRGRGLPLSANGDWSEVLLLASGLCDLEPGPFSAWSSDSLLR